MLEKSQNKNISEDEKNIIEKAIEIGLQALEQEKKLKINKIKINSYGKLKEKEIKLKDGINIIYGKNESGKSTLLNFIVNSFYGIS